MASTWIGGGNNKASNPMDWSPEGVPTNTDADITHGTINIEGSIFSGSTSGPQTFLDVQGGDVTIHMRRSPQGELPVVRPIDVQSGFAAIDVRDSAQFNLFEQTGASTLVDLLPSTTQWSGMFSVAGELKVAGTGTFVPTEDSLVFSNRLGQSAHAILDVNIAKGPPIHIFNASMEIRGFVAPGEAIAMSGDMSRPSFLRLDLPRAFSGEIGLGQDSQVDLVGLFSREKVDGYSLRNDLLSFYSHNDIVYSVVLEGGSAIPAVAKAGGDVFLYTNDVAPSRGTLLPQHG
jgi:hypothetical protein